MRSLDHHLAPAEVGLGLGREAHHHVRADVGEQQHLVAPRLLRVDDHRQRVVVDQDQVGGVLAAGAVLGDHRHDRLAHVAHGPPGDEGPAHALGVRGVGGRRQPELGEIVTGHDGQHAGRSLGLGHVDGGDPGVGERRPDVGEPRRARQGDVLDVGAALGQHSWVLDPHDPVPEDAAQQSSFPWLARRCGTRRRPSGRGDTSAGTCLTTRASVCLILMPGTRARRRGEPDARRSPSPRDPDRRAASPAAPRLDRDPHLPAAATGHPQHLPERPATGEGRPAHAGLRPHPAVRAAAGGPAGRAGRRPERPAAGDREPGARRGAGDRGPGRARCRHHRRHLRAALAAARRRRRGHRRRAA